MDRLPLLESGHIFTRVHRWPLIWVLIAAAGAGLLLASVAQAQPPHTARRTAPEGLHDLMRRIVVGAPGREVVVSRLEFRPGPSSPPHRHNAQVFLYVLRGKVLMQVKGGPLKTLGPGQMFYEGPSDIHTVSADASKTKPAVVLVFIIKKKGAPGFILVPSGRAQ